MEVTEVHQHMNGQGSFATYAYEILLSYKKSCIQVSSNEMEECKTYYTEWGN